MTTVAWDGKTLAADRRFSAGNGIFTVTKIQRVNGCLVGLTGNFSQALELAKWLKDGADPKEFPKEQRDVDNGNGMVVVQADGTLIKYESSPVPITLHEKQFAFGSGGDFARAAMFLGKCACDAVEIAMVFDPATGNGVDTLTF